MIIAADDEDLEQRDRGDDRDRSATRGTGGSRSAGSSGPGPTRNSVISRLPNEMMKPNSAAATTPGRISGNVTRRNVVHGPAPRFWRRLLDRAVEAHQARGDQPHRPRNRDDDVGEDEAGQRGDERQPRQDLRLDLEHVDRRARHHARDDERRQQQAGRGSPARGSGSAPGTGSPARRGRGRPASRTRRPGGWSRSRRRSCAGRGWRRNQRKVYPDGREHDHLVRGRRRATTRGRAGAG